MPDDEPRQVGYNRQELIRSYPDASMVQIFLDMTDIVNLTEHHLKGEVYDMASGVWVPSGMRMMNDEGVKAMISQLQLYGGPNTFLSNVDDEDIFKIMMPYHRKLAAMIIDKQEEWEVEDAYIRMIVQNITDTILLAMKRGLFHKTLDALTQATRITEAREVEKKHGRIPFFS